MYQRDRLKLLSHADQDLTIDWCHLSTRPENTKLLIIHSGLHGIEGYTGSAIQNMLLTDLQTDSYSNQIDFLFVHGINPYGFKYGRKVTEFNIDLNRNCVVDPSDFDFENRGYDELRSLLMPERPVNLKNPSSRYFHLVALRQFISKSFSALRQATLQGQYSHPKGFYYGGNQYASQVKILRHFLAERIQPYEVALNIDLHTGYGQRGQLHLFINRPDNLAVVEGLEQVFAGVAIDWADGKDFYTIHGEYVNWISTLAPEVLCLPMLFEYGTMNSQTKIGALKSIETMILENQGVHHGYQSAKDELTVKNRFREMYYPSSAVWRSQVIRESKRMIAMLLTNFEQLEEGE